MSDIPEVPEVPSLQAARKALVMFVSDLVKNESAPADVRARAESVLTDWMMAGLLELARRGAGKPGGES
jgi:hypothetical protein